MSVTMVKKRLANGEACPKCVQAEELLRRRGLWQRVDAVVWADEGDPSSPGLALARRLGVAEAPFFVVDEGGEPVVYRTVIALGRALAQPRAPVSPSDGCDVAALAEALDGAEPPAIVLAALERWGEACAIAFSGAEDVALIDMAASSGLPFSAFCLDTGRLHPETYAFIERVRTHYGIPIDVLSPDAEAVQALVRNKGLFSFYEDGHGECCGIRKVEPLRRALRGRLAWMTGQREDQSPATRAALPQVSADPREGGALVKLNPLARWTSADVWRYIRAHDVPYNPLHERGFRSIGCEPCTRPVHPGQHEREGRWWWEEATRRECGLHLGP